MEIIAPVYITDSMLISSNVPETEDGVTEYDEDVSYVAGARVVVTETGIHMIYESLVADNINHYPPNNTSGEIVYWMGVYASNPWRLFDGIIAPTRCVMSGGLIQISVEPGLIDTIAVMNIEGTAATVTMINSGTQVYTETKSIGSENDENIIFNDLPAYPNAVVSVSVSATAVGEIIFGTTISLGSTKANPSIGITDYSVKEDDVYGNYTIFERAFSKNINANFYIPIAIHAGVIHILEKYRSTPLVWIASDIYSITVIYGFYKDFTVTISNTNFAECALSIEGLGSKWVNSTARDNWIEPWDGIVDLITFALVNIDEPITSLLSPSPVSDSVSLTTILDMADIEVLSTCFSPVGTCTISNAAPCVITCNSHGLSDNHAVIFHTTGTLPAPLIIDRIYYVKNAAENTFNIALTSGGSTIDTTTAGSGTHTLLAEAT